MNSTSSIQTTNLDTSKSEITTNLSFYLNDYEEQQVNFICLRLIGNLNYNNIISGKFNFKV